MTKKANLVKGEQKKKSIAPIRHKETHQLRKGKRVARLSKNSKSMDVDGAKGINNLPRDILMDILSRLPVTARYLLRYKCVSKYWKTLISDPCFQRKHLSRTKNNHGSRKFLFSQMSLGEDNVFSFKCASLSSLWSVQLVKDSQKLDSPPECKPCHCKVYCCRDGLVLIGVHSYPDRNLRLLLWNPTTRESAVLPDLEFPPVEFCAFGLAYDSTCDDYKILKIDSEGRNEILALKSGSAWRKVDKHPNGIWPVLSNVVSLAFVHGAFHWLGLSLSDSAVSFSVSDEVYGEIPLPKGKEYMACLERGLSVLDGMLCCYSMGMDSLNVSVMEDYGAKESWSGLFIIGNGSYSVIPRYRFADGELMLCCAEQGRFVSLFRTSKGPFGFCSLLDTFKEGFVYTESLISLKLQYVQKMKPAA